MKYYAVRKGRQVGVFESWEEANESIYKFIGAEYKKFSDKEDALIYMGEISRVKQVIDLLKDFNINELQEVEDAVKDLIVVSQIG